MKNIKYIFVCFFLLIAQVALAGMRIKDIAQIHGARDNQLVGYGLVVGLNGTGDKANTIFTIRSVTSMLRKMGMTVSSDEIQVKNVAAVMITASLPPFAREGSRIDVTVSSIGDASSLEGGILLQAPLRAANNQVYAVAQGAVSIGGRQAGGQRGQGNYAVVGLVANGAIIENEVPTEILQNGKMELVLNNPDFTTAARLAKQINMAYQGMIAYAKDAAAISIDVPLSYQDERNRVIFVANVEALEVETDNAAKVVINERTGTIVAGSRVQVHSVAISHGDLSIKVGEQQTTNPNEKPDEPRFLVMPEMTNVGDIAKSLNAIGVQPRDIIAIFEVLKKAGALQADLVIM